MINNDGKEGLRRVNNDRDLWFMDGETTLIIFD